MRPPTPCTRSAMNILRVDNSPGSPSPNCRGSAPDVRIKGIRHRNAVTPTPRVRNTYAPAEPSNETILPTPRRSTTSSRRTNPITPQHKRSTPTPLKPPEPPPEPPTSPPVPRHGNGTRHRNTERSTSISPVQRAFVPPPGPLARTDQHTIFGEPRTMASQLRTNRARTHWHSRCTYP